MPNVEYERDNPFHYGWTEKAFDSIRAGTLNRRLIIHDGKVLAARINGDCPRCQHQLTFSLPLIGALSEGGVLGQDTPMVGTTYPVDVPCGCKHAHPEAPDGVLGCGIWFRVELKAGRDG